jgi:ABC-type transporter Mla subunit MlaD
MTGEEMERAIAFVLEQQASLTATVGRLSEKVDRNANSITALLAVAEIQAGEIKDLADSVKAIDTRQREADERGRHTDERLSALINTVERIISERQNGKGGE